MGFVLVMKTYRFENIIGKFNLDSKFKLIKGIGEVEITSKNILDYKEVLHLFKKEKYFNDFYNQNLLLTSKDLIKSVNEDYFVRETVKELDNLYKARKSLVDEKLLEHLDEVIFEKEAYLENLMKNFCPNLLAVAGVFVGSRLLKMAGSLEKLSKMTARKIQVLGAETAFFKFLSSQSKKSPKYGIIFYHESVKNSKNKGKAARVLSDKICMAVKIDFFKGKFIGDKLRGELHE